MRRPNNASPYRPIALSPYRPIALSPYRPIALSPYRPIALSPYRPIALSPSRPIGTIARLRRRRGTPRVRGLRVGGTRGREWRGGRAQWVRGVPGLPLGVARPLEA